MENDEKSTDADYDLAQKLETFKNYPPLRKVWEGRKVYIWSGVNNGYWRITSCGYSEKKDGAGRFTFEDAFWLTRSCDPTAQIQFEVVTETWTDADSRLFDLAKQYYSVLRRKTDLLNENVAIDKKLKAAETTIAHFHQDLSLVRNDCTDGKNWQVMLSNILQERKVLLDFSFDICKLLPDLRSVLCEGNSTDKLDRVTRRSGVVARLDQACKKAGLK